MSEYIATYKWSEAGYSYICYPDQAEAKYPKILYFAELYNDRHWKLYQINPGPSFGKPNTNEEPWNSMMQFGHPLVIIDEIYGDKDFIEFFVDALNEKLAREQDKKADEIITKIIQDESKKTE